MPHLIYNQHDIPKDRYRYGLRSSAATGCGWIATYNALVLMGRTTDIPQLIRYYEWQLPFIHGNAGTCFWGPAVCLKKMGFSVEICADPQKYDERVKAADAAMLFYRWHKGCRLGAHFVALHHTQQGFVGYNTYTNSTGPDLYGESLREFLKEKKYFGTILITAHK